LAAFAPATFRRAGRNDSADAQSFFPEKTADTANHVACLEEPTNRRTVRAVAFRQVDAFSAIPFLDNPLLTAPAQTPA
jgi:hypothetical protein